MIATRKLFLDDDNLNPKQKELAFQLGIKANQIWKKESESDQELEQIEREQQLEKERSDKAQQQFQEEKEKELIKNKTEEIKNQDDEYNQVKKDNIVKDTDSKLEEKQLKDNIQQQKETPEEIEPPQEEVQTEFKLYNNILNKLDLILERLVK